MTFREALTAREVLITAESTIGLGYFASTFAVVFRLGWLRATRRAPDGPSMFGWFGLNLVRSIIGSAYRQSHDVLLTGMVWSARACGAAFAVITVGLVWNDVQLGLY